MRKRTKCLILVLVAVMVIGVIIGPLATKRADAWWPWSKTPKTEEEKIDPLIKAYPSFEEVSPGVFDTGNGTVYIRSSVGKEKYYSELMAETIADLVSKKEAWQQKFPNKKIVAITGIVANYYSHNIDKAYSFTSGLLIHYETD